MADQLHVKQLLLVSRPNVHFIVANNHREGTEPVFVFGRTLGLSHYAPAPMAVEEPELFRSLVLDYVDREAQLKLWGRTYSVLGVTNLWVDLAVCWPISPTLFHHAEDVAFDMKRPAAPIDELEEAITEWKQIRTERREP